MNIESNQLGQINLIAPLLVVVGGAILLLLLETFANPEGERGHRGYLMPVAVVICLGAMVADLFVWSSTGGHPQSAFNGLITVDRMSVFFDCLFLTAAALTAMLARAYMHEHRFEFGEFYALLLFATAGMMILAASSDLVTLFIGIETMSIAVYVLTGCWRRSPRSSEAAMKYFVIGAFATAILLYGMALLYGMVGSTSLATIGAHAQRGSGQPLFLIGMLLVLVALGFKIAAVPFHMWAPDAYEGAPTPVTGFMAAGVKAAGFAALLRLFGGALDRPELAFGSSGWASVCLVLSALTMTLGNLAALSQDNIKRLLAYSSIAHAGYLLLGVAAMGIVGPSARGPILFYLAAYTFTTLGAFGVVAWVGSYRDERLKLEEWAGLAQRHPAAALAMTFFLLSLGGVPPTAGFFGKFYLFRAALENDRLAPYVILAVLNSVVSVAYYLRVVTAMYFREPGREGRSLHSPAVTAALVVAVAGTLAFGILPSWLLDTASTAIGGG